MLLAVEIIKNIVVILLTAVQFAMLARAILSWFPIDSNKFIDFLYAVTEPFIQPVRVLFEKLNWFQSLPIDISFLVSYMLLSVILMILP
ncbi:MAG: YggT family protein [Clostridia bacterium]|nr:YggT family protein [Clostridia bacterium]